MSGDDKSESVGSVGEEAIKLLNALQGWARENRNDYAGAAADVVSEAASSFHALNEHIATGGENCRYCPICQLISAVRETSPEVKQHLSTASTSLMHAVAGIIASHVSDQAGKTRTDAAMEHIDLSDGDDWDDD